MKLSEALHIVGTGLAYERSSKQQVQSGGRRCLELEKEAAELEAERDALKAERDNWIDTAKQHCRNEEYYRGLVVQSGKTIDSLCAKVDSLVAGVMQIIDKHR